MRNHTSSIGLKALILVSFVATATLAGLFVANTLWQRHLSLERIRQTALASASLIDLIVSEPMLLGDNKATADQIAKIAASHADTKVFLTDFGGNVTYGTDLALLRQPLAKSLPFPELAGLLEEALTGGANAEALSQTDTASTMLNGSWNTTK